MYGFLNVDGCIWIGRGRESGGGWGDGGGGDERSKQEKGSWMGG